MHACMHACIYAKLKDPPLFCAEADDYSTLMQRNGNLVRTTKGLEVETRVGNSAT